MIKEEHVDSRPYMKHGVSATDWDVGPTMGWSMVVSCPMSKSNQDNELCLIEGHLG